MKRVVKNLSIVSEHGASLVSSEATSNKRSLSSNPLQLLCIICLIVIAMIAIIYPVISPYSYSHGTNDLYANISYKHWLGTDKLGYDTMTRLAYGARVSLFVGVGVEAIVILIGGSIGLTAGYLGRSIDNWLMRFTDLMFAFPDILLAILIMAVRGASILNIFIALGITGWPSMARLVRSQTISLRKREFIESARAIGVSTPRIIWRHILPNILSAIIVYSTVDIAGIIIAESTLSFLGIGVQDPIPSWGKMIEEPIRSSSYLAHPELVLYPSLFLAFTVLSLNFLGDSLRDSLDPRSV